MPEFADNTIMATLPLRKEDLKYSWTSQCGPLQPFLDDSAITEIMVNGSSKIFIEQKGVLKKTQAKFKNDQELIDLMVMMAQSLGKTLDADNPCVDGRLPDGSRIHCIVPPVAVDGPSLTIRKFSKEAMTYQQLVQNSFFDERMAYFLSVCVQAKLNIVVSGGTGSGKTTLLNVLSTFIPPHERIVTIEDTAELKIKNDNLVRLEARPPTPQDPGISQRHLLIQSLRMRPDRIIVGECRSAEAFDMLQAMNTGHEGSMTSIHSNTARDALRRLESMVLLSGLDIPMKIVRQNISSAVHLILQIQRCNDGTRRLVEMIEIGGMEGDVILTQDIFKWTPNTGFKSMGFVPGFIKIFKERGIDFPPDFFNDQYTIRTQRSEQTASSGKKVKS